MSSTPQLHPKARAARLRNLADRFFAKADKQDTEAGFAAPQKTLFREAKADAQAQAKNFREVGQSCLIQALALDP